jgi:hypothetical protein
MVSLSADLGSEGFPAKVVRLYALESFVFMAASFRSVNAGVADEAP